MLFSIEMMILFVVLDGFMYLRHIRINLRINKHQLANVNCNTDGRKLIKEDSQGGTRSCFDDKFDTVPDLVLSDGCLTIKLIFSSVVPDILANKYLVEN